MPDYGRLELTIESIIDELKGICNQSGLGNAGGEERVITTVFLYKFLNDKFVDRLKKFSKEIGVSIEDIFSNKNDELDALYDSYSGNVAFNYEDTIEYLINRSSNDKFYQLFDESLERISNNPRNSDFNIETSDGTKKPLFEGISKEVEQSAKNNFVRSVFSAISKQALDFSGAFEENFDFYSRIFEYLIKDYNVASGKYAEYFTPQAVSKIIAKIMVGMSEKITASEIYDPSAGSGSLVLHLANELGKEGDYGRAIVYTQDISQKSSRFLRINLLLNGLSESLHHAIQGDTLLKPAHFKIEGEDTSGLKQFDYVVANPPFKLDFSSTRDNIDNLWSSVTNEEGEKRFFAGVPKIPNKKKDSMPIYLLFIQHIIYSMKPNGKAAVVVPTGFITAQGGIEYNIRRFVTDNKMLKGVISMPSNIFANTGTNVSVLFFDKTNTSNDAIFVDASKLGTKVKEGKNQRTVLSDGENKKITQTFIGRNTIDDFSIVVKYDEIKEKNYSWSAGQYFEVKIEYDDITQEEYETIIDDFNKSFEEFVAETSKFQKEMKEILKGLKIHD